MQITVEGIGLTRSCDVVLVRTQFTLNERLLAWNLRDDVVDMGRRAGFARLSIGTHGRERSVMEATTSSVERIWRRCD